MIVIFVPSFSLPWTKTPVPAVRALIPKMKSIATLPPGFADSCRQWGSKYASPREIFFFIEEVCVLVAGCCARAKSQIQGLTWGVRFLVLFSFSCSVSAKLHGGAIRSPFFTGRPLQGILKLSCTIICYSWTWIQGHSNKWLSPGPYCNPGDFVRFVNPQDYEI